MKPDICTSTMCNDLGGDYCPKCSHAIFCGEGKDKNGKLWKWDFNSHFGPNFLRKGGKALAVQPSEKSHAWPIFEEWHKRVWEEVKPDGGNDKAGDDRP